MSDIETGMRTYLLTKSGVTDLVAARIYPDAPSQGSEMPAIALTEISAQSEQHLKGASGFATSRIEAECFSGTKSGSVALRTQVRIAMQNHGSNDNGDRAMGDETALGVVVEDQRSKYERPTDGSDSGRYVASVDLIITHQEAVTA